MLRQIDAFCLQEGVYPHAFLSAHAHNYQRYTLNRKKAAIKANQLLLEKYNDTNYGYLRIHVDKEQLRIGFHQVGASTLAQSRYDMVTVDLADHTMVAN